MNENMKRHEEIKTLYLSSKLPIIKPLWQIEISEMDFSMLREPSFKNLSKDEISVIENVSIESIFDNMYSANQEMFREKILYNQHLSERKISDVLDCWIRGIKLIPPILKVIDGSLNDINPNTDIVHPDDGKHRINVAYFYGVTEIPIIVLNTQLEKLNRLLRPK